VKPEDYLKAFGMDVKTTVLISYVDGVLRNVDLLELMKGYEKINAYPQHPSLCKQ